ncbi:ABC transporter permease [Paenarthrobacter nicotinovorans]|uniref:ABC transporter permease n=1 Tax=Paenarthrobacter nicotinovorans TaxID=29320 RepID=UPI0037487EEB
MKPGIRGVTAYISRRALSTALSILGLATLVFLMVKMIPGDEAQVAAGENAGPEQIEAARQALGLDQPLPVQYAIYLGRLLQGDLGRSITSRQEVSDELARVLPATFELVTVAMALSVLMALLTGTIAAFRKNRGFDSSARVAAVICAGLPTFWLALTAQYVVGGKLGWFPISGQQSFGVRVPHVTGSVALDALLAGNLPAFSDAMAHLVLPATILAIPIAAQLHRVVRSALVGVLNQDLVQVVRAKGSSDLRLAWNHVLPNGSGPIANMTGLLVGVMLGTAVLVESVFARPGVGDYLASAVIHKDTFAVLGTVLFLGTLIILINVAVDVLQLVMDPRVRTAELARRAR